MVKYWQSRTIPQRVILAMMLVEILAVAGALVWDYPWWPFSLLLGVTVILSIAIGARGPSLRRRTTRATDS